MNTIKNTTKLIEQHHGFIELMKTIRKRHKIFKNVSKREMTANFILSHVSELEEKVQLLEAQIEKLKLNDTTNDKRRSDPESDREVTKGTI